MTSNSNEVKAADLSKAIVKELMDYTQDIAEAIKKDVEEVAKECVKELKKTSLKRTGKYAKGWRKKKDFENNETIRVTVHNKNYRLPHLLENGHKTANGKGFVQGKPHIRPAELRAEEELVRRIKRTVENGGK